MQDESEHITENEIVNHKCFRCPYSTWTGVSFTCMYPLTCVKKDGFTIDRLKNKPDRHEKQPITT